MTGIIDMLILGFVIGFTGALAPGPTLIATINASLTGGWSTGPKVTLGHMAVELLMVVLIVAGLSVVFSGYSWLIAITGGAALVVFGVLTLSGSRYAQIDTTRQPEPASGPVIAGIITSMGNPYFWIWWFTVGSALVLSAMSGGIASVSAFIAGHWGADLAWYTVVSASIHKGRFLLGTREYRIVLAICGIFLIGFGTYYLSTVIF